MPKRYLDVFDEEVRVNGIDLSAMIARCIEHSDIDIKCLHYLIDYLRGKTLELKILPGKYNIDAERYAIAKHHGIQDSFYDDLDTKENKGFYTSYRDAYHCLLYGNKRYLEVLVNRWKCMQDCTYGAALDFFAVKEYDVVVNNIR